MYIGLWMGVFIKGRGNDGRKRERGKECSQPGDSSSLAPAESLVLPSVKKRLEIERGMFQDQDQLEIYANLISGRKSVCYQQSQIYIASNLCILKGFIYKRKIFLFDIFFWRISPVLFSILFFNEYIYLFIIFNISDYN